MMKTISLLVVLAIVAVVPLGCGKEKKDKGEKGALESAIDYGTGKTQIEAGQAAKRKLIGISIQEAVSYYRIQEEREPTSLQDLVNAGNLASEYTKDEYGRPLQSSVKNGKLVVRSIKPDGTLSWEKTF
jgi:hypothetical protein